MAKVLIVYFSASGNTERMAQYIAEGVRFSGQQATVKKIADISRAEDLAGYDGYLFGAPTYSLDMPQPVKDFFLMAEQAGITGKPAGAFGSYTHDVAYKHDTYAPALILDTMQRVLKMPPFKLGALTLIESSVDKPEGIHNCQTYGKEFGAGLGKA